MLHKNWLVLLQVSVVLFIILALPRTGNSVLAVGPCVPLSLACRTDCGLPHRCISDGCGGQTCCPPTTACVPTSKELACVDSDGGSYPNVLGHVTISAPALPQTLNDTCMSLKVTSTTSQWIIQSPGTHVAEKTCVNTATGAYADSVIACPFGCANGACNSTAPTATPTPLSTNRPTPTPPQRTCGLDGECPVGYKCYQPTSTCPKGTLCTQEIRAPYCVPINCNPPCKDGSTCVEQEASKCPPGAYCPIKVIDPICVLNTPIPTPKNMCALHPQGDANCDNVVNGADFEVYKIFMIGKGYIDAKYSADFNTDGKVNMIDYEIWRNTFYK